MNTHTKNRRDFLSRLLLGSGGPDHIDTLEARAMLSVNLVDDISDITVDRNHAPTIIELNNRYDDPAITGSVAKFESVLGDIYVVMNDQQTPLTVANFFRYADADLWDDTIIHRSVPGFIVQGGGFGNAPAYTSVPQFAAVQNEPGISNLRGTIAMAKLGGNPNSATSQWFFNLANNSANLDNQNGGFTVFGRVAGDGMNIVDAIAAVPIWNASTLNGAFTDMPLRNFANTGLPTSDNTVSFFDITRASEIIYTVSVGNAALVNANIVNGFLNLSYGAGQTGSTTVTVRATSVDSTTGAPSFVEDTFSVTIADVPDATPTASIVGISISDSPASAFNTKMRATIRINDSASVVANSIGTGDIVLLGPSGYWQPGTIVGLPEQQNHSLLLTFDFPARSGAWDSSDNGNYALRLLANSVSVNGGGSMAVQTFWANTLWFNAPTAERVSESVTDGGTFMDVTVRYRDYAGSTVGISWGSIGNGDVSLTKGSTTLSGSLVSRSIPAAGQLLATYRFAAPGGFWDQSDNGSWVVRTVANQVFDVQGNLLAPLALRTYNLFFATPNATITNYTAVNAGAAATVTVQYQAASNGLMSWASLGAGDLELRGPNGYVAIASLVTRSAAQVNGAWVYTVVYSLAAPGGTWGSSDNGTYSIWMRANEVIDAVGRAVPAVQIDSRGLFF